MPRVSDTTKWRGPHTFFRWKVCGSFFVVRECCGGHGRRRLALVRTNTWVIFSWASAIEASQ